MNSHIRKFAQVFLVIATLLVGGVAISMMLGLSLSKTSVKPVPVVKVSVVQIKPKEVLTIPGIYKIIVHQEGYSVLSKSSVRPGEILRQYLWDGMPFIKEHEGCSCNGRSTVKTYIYEDAQQGQMYAEVKFWNKTWFEIIIHVDKSPDLFVGG